MYSASVYEWCEYLFIVQPTCCFSIPQKKKEKKRPTFSLHSLSLSPFWDHSSIIGLYVSLVLVIGRFVRIFFAGGSSQIMYQELPSVDNILNLCLDIYMVRESQDYRMEEYLFSKLIFVYRSPETLIKWTKIKYSWYIFFYFEFFFSRWCQIILLVF